MTEKQLGWAGVILGVVGLVLAVAALIKESLAVGLIGLAFVLGAFLALFLLYRTAKQLGQAVQDLEEPPITLLSVETTLKFEDKQARRTFHTDTRKVRVNHETEPTHFWFKSLHPPQALRNVRIDGKAPDVLRQEANGLRVGKLYEHGFHRGDEFTAELTAEWMNTYPDAEEYHIHRVLDKTENLRIRIIFHPHRPYRNPRVLKGPGVGSYRKATDVRLTQSANALEVEVESP